MEKIHLNLRGFRPILSPEERRQQSITIARRWVNTGRSEDAYDNFRSAGLDDAAIRAEFTGAMAEPRATMLLRAIKLRKQGHPNDEIRTILNIESSAAPSNSLLNLTKKFGIAWRVRVLGQVCQHNDRIRSIESVVADSNEVPNG